MQCILKPGPLSKNPCRANLPTGQRWPNPPHSHGDSLCWGIQKSTTKLQKFQELWEQTAFPASKAAGRFSAVVFMLVSFSFLQKNSRSWRGFCNRGVGTIIQSFRIPDTLSQMFRVDRRFRLVWTSATLFWKGLFFWGGHLETCSPKIERMGWSHRRSKQWELTMNFRAGKDRSQVDVIVQCFFWLVTKTWHGSEWNHWFNRSVSERNIST